MLSTHTILGSSLHWVRSSLPTHYAFSVRISHHSNGGGGGTRFAAPKCHVAPSERAPPDLKLDVPDQSRVRDGKVREEPFKIRYDLAFSLAASPGKCSLSIHLLKLHPAPSCTALPSGADFYL